MSFLTLSNAEISFLERKLTWNYYTAVKALLTTKWVELIIKKKFVKTVLNEKSKTFVVYILALQVPQMKIHLLQTAYIIAGNLV